MVCGRWRVSCQTAAVSRSQRLSSGAAAGQSPPVYLRSDEPEPEPEPVLEPSRDRAGPRRAAAAAVSCLRGCQQSGSPAAPGKLNTLNQVSGIQSTMFDTA